MIFFFNMIALGIVICCILWSISIVEVISYFTFQKSTYRDMMFLGILCRSYDDGPMTDDEIDKVWASRDVAHINLNYTNYVDG